MSECVVIDNATIECWIDDRGNLTLTVTSKIANFTSHNGKIVKGKIPWPSMGG